MEQNKLYDLVVIGASREGLHTAKYFSKKYQNLNILLVSSSFNYGKPLGLSYTQDTVVFSEYLFGIIKLYLKTSGHICTKNVILATGTQPRMLDCVNTRRVAYNIFQLSKGTKKHTVAVIGQSKDFADLLSKLSRKFKKVYLCTAESELDIPETVTSLINQYKNIQLLPLSLVLKVQPSEKGLVYNIKLNTNGFVKCNFILALTERMPAKNCLNNQMVALDSNGYYKINGSHKTGPVPGIFAVGSCTDHKSRLNLANISLVHIV